MINKQDNLAFVTSTTFPNATFFTVDLGGDRTNRLNHVLRTIKLNNTEEIQGTSQYQFTNLLHFLNFPGSFYSPTKKLGYLWSTSELITVKKRFPAKKNSTFVDRCRHPVFYQSEFSSDFSNRLFRRFGHHRWQRRSEKKKMIFNLKFFFPQKSGQGYFVSDNGFLIRYRLAGIPVVAESAVVLPKKGTPTT